MSSPRLAIPDLPQQNSQLQAGTEGQPQQSTITNIQQQAIANLAYELWQQRGWQQGSPEEDWNRAEQLLQATKRQSALGSRGSTLQMDGPKKGSSQKRADKPQRRAGTLVLGTRSLPHSPF